MQMCCVSVSLCFRVDWLMGRGRRLSVKMPSSSWRPMWLVMRLPNMRCSWGRKLRNKAADASLKIWVRNYSWHLTLCTRKLCLMICLCPCRRRSEEREDHHLQHVQRADDPAHPEGNFVHLSLEVSDWLLVCHRLIWLVCFRLISDGTSF